MVYEQYYDKASCRFGALETYADSCFNTHLSYVFLVLFMYNLLIFIVDHVVSVLPGLLTIVSELHELVYLLH